MHEGIHQIKGHFNLACRKVMLSKSISQERNPIAGQMIKTDVCLPIGEILLDSGIGPGAGQRPQEGGEENMEGEKGQMPTGPQKRASGERDGGRDVASKQKSGGRSLGLGGGGFRDWGPKVIF